MSQEQVKYAAPFDHSKRGKENTGEIYGQAGLAYEQYGQLYNAAYQPVDIRGRVMEIDPRFLAAAKAAVKQANAPKPAPQAAGDDDDDPDPEKEMEEVDIMGWARGERNDYPWGTIQAAIAERFQDGIPNNRANAIKKIEKHMGPVNPGSPDERQQDADPPPAEPADAA